MAASITVTSLVCLLLALLQHATAQNCPAGDLPGFDNAMVTNGDTIAAPYTNGDIVSYACNSGYTKNPSDAALTCACTAPTSGAGSWGCLPASATTTACTAPTTTVISGAPGVKAVFSSVFLTTSLAVLVL